MNERQGIPDEGLRGDLEFGTIPRMLARAVERFPERDAVIDGDVRLSYRDLAWHAEQIARALIAHEIAPGDRVALWAPNCWEWIAAALAVHGVGGVLIPLNTRWKGPEAAYVLAKSRARLLLTITDFLETDYVAMLAEARASLPDLRATVVMRGRHDADAIGFAAFLTSGQAVPDSTARARAAAVQPDHVADLLYTSGTTGQPKGVPSTHAQTLRAFRDWGAIVGLRAGDRYLVVVPFFHSFGYKAGWLAALMAGATVFPHAAFDPRQVLERVGRERISVLPGPPTLYQSLLARPELHHYDLSSLRLAVTGAAVIPVELIRRMQAELGFQTIVTGYGLTEATGVSTLSRPGDDPALIASTSGRAIPGVELRIVDERRKPLPAGEAGEVAIRGYGVTRGYDGESTATAEAIDDAGWLYTGDIGVLDPQGNLRITDRKKDMYIVGGFKAYPAEIEGILLQHPAIAQVAVVGAPDERLGEVGHAFVIARPGAPIDPAELVGWSRDHMANYKVPRRFEIVDALPLNATGKVQKFRLRERAAAAQAAEPREERR